MGCTNYDVRIWDLRITNWDLRIGIFDLRCTNYDFVNVNRNSIIVNCKSKIVNRKSKIVHQKLSVMKEQMKQRTKNVGLEVIKLIDELPSKTSVWVIAKQIVRSSTSIGANYRVVSRAKSQADFINKLKIVEEETDETIFWLEILVESNLVIEERVTTLKNELNQILAIVVSSIKTIKNKKQ